MSSSVPTLGYPSKTAAIRALVSEGLSRPVIASRLGISVSLVHALQKGSATVTKPNTNSTGRMNTGAIFLGENLRRQLRPAAAARSITVDALAILIIEKAVEDRLIDAVLDDRGVEYK